MFDGLTPRLEAARQIEDALDVALARRFNTFDFLDRSELGLSRIVAELLDVNGRHGQGGLFLKILLDKLGYSAQAGMESSSVVREKAIEDGRIDVFVRLGSSCLAIENKPYARDQKAQIYRYLVWLQEWYKEFRLIYLSATGEPPLDGSVTLGDLREHGTHDRFKIMAYAGAWPWDDEYNDYRLDYSLADWFADCQRNCGVDRLRWFLREAELFCRHRFGGEIVTKNERSTLVDFVRGSTDRMETAAAVYECWAEIKEQVVRAFYDALWRAEGDYGDGPWEGDWEYSDGRGSRGKCYWSMSKEAWSADREGNGTSIRLENDSQGPNGWFIGIHSPVALSEANANELQERLKSVAPTQTPEDHWPWWIWVDEKWRNWDSIIPALHKEIKEPGGITRYFVDKLVAIAKAATAVIDEIEGPD